MLRVYVTGAHSMSARTSCMHCPIEVRSLIDVNKCNDN